VAEPPVQYVDPAVSRAKFDAEIEDFRRLDADFARRGWFLIAATFPIATILFSAVKASPPAVVFAARFNFTNYDVEPPSVVFVNPFTGEPYDARSVPAPINMRIPPVELAPGVQIPQEQSLLQAYGPDSTPFFCVAGVREYHDHPAHSGDRWELHRTDGAGHLVRLADLIWKHGTDLIAGYAITMVPQVTFQRQPAPE
jgi:hypothetical protein